MTDALVRDFVREQRELLGLELESEQTLEKEVAQSSHQLSAAAGSDRERVASHVLGSLEASDVSIGLYGRTVVELVVHHASADASQGAPNGSTAQAAAAPSQLLLPAHRFTVGDEVEIRTKQNRKGSPGGVISAVTDTAISVALFGQKTRSSNNSNGNSNSKNGNNHDGRNNDDDDVESELGDPPLRLIPKSSVEVHRKLMHGLNDLERHGANHELCGPVIEACFNPRPSSTRQAKSQPAERNRNTPIQKFNADLDASQVEAIQFALDDEQRISLIHGPPGTGKTTTVAELIRHAVHVRGMKVLVTAPSNVAVDNVLERLVASATPSTAQKRKNAKRTSLRAVRLGHPARIKPTILSYSLEALVQSADGTEIVNDVRKELKSYIRVLSNPKSRGNEKRVAYREMKALRKEVRTREEKVVRELIGGAQVVLATTVGAANRMLNHVEGGFDLVVIDEAAQALEASCWIPMLRGKKVVLAGDHRQLPPTIKSRSHKAQAGLAKTLFERLMELYGDDKKPEVPRISRMLKVQYRMHRQIADWASTAMYGGELSTHPSVETRLLSQLGSIKETQDAGTDAGETEGNNESRMQHELNSDDVELLGTTMMLVDTAGCDMHDTTNDAGSRFNEGEAKIVDRHVRRLLSFGMKQADVAIITPYNGQVELLRNMLLPEYPSLEIRSVDGFQGGEREAVVLSLVRSSERGGIDGIGFLKDDRRQNVAVTRAKRHVAVVCDSETVSKSKFIASLLAWIEEHGQQRSAIEYLAAVESSFDADFEADMQNAEAEIEKMMKGPDQNADSPANTNAKGENKVATKNQPKHVHSHSAQSKNQQRNKENDLKQTQQQRKQEDELLKNQLQESKRKALLDKISAFNESAQPGDSLPLSSELNGYERRLVHEFCEQLGLTHVSSGTEGVDRRIVIGKEAKGVAAESNATISSINSLSGGLQTRAEQQNDATLGLHENNDDGTPTKSAFATLALDDDDDDDSSSSSSSSDEKESDPDAPVTATGASLLAQLAIERRQRESARLEQQNQAAAASADRSGAGMSKSQKKKNKKKGGQKLGGSRKPTHPPTQDDSHLDDLDDMAFLDTQIERSQNAHGRKVVGAGKGYRTIINGVLNAKPAPREPPKNAKAAASLQAKLKSAQNGRKTKGGGKKKKK